MIKCREKNGDKRASTITEQLFKPCLYIYYSDLAQKCPYFDRPYNSFTIGANRLHGDSLVFGCHEGYELVGSRSIVCTRSKSTGWNWKPELPKCVPRELPSTVASNTVG